MIDRVSRNLGKLLGIFGFSLLFSFVGFGLITQMPAGLVPDDGYFYSKIAYNLANHGFSSFDGINPTDGYHQLWEYTLALVALVGRFVTESKTTLLFLFVLLDVFLLSLASFFSGKNWLERGFVFLGLGGCEFLMEGHLYGCLIALGCWFLLTRKHGTPLSGFGVVCFGLIPLARIDTAWVPLAIGLALLRFKDQEAGFKIVAASVLGGACHFGLMIRLHGHLFSVSSELKSEADHGIHRLLENLGQRTPTLPIPFEPQGFFALVLFALSAFFVFRTTDGERRPILIGLWVGTAIFTLGHLLLSETHPWYFAPAYVGFPICLFWSNPAPSRKIVLACASVSGLLFAALLVKGIRNRSEAPSVAEFVATLNRRLKPTARIYMVDGSGYLGYFLDRPVINGDGLVNSHSYAQDLQNNRLVNYLSANGIEFLITNKVLEPNAPLVDIGGLVVTRNQAKPLLTKTDNGHYFFTNYVLWKLHPISSQP